MPTWGISTFSRLRLQSAFPFPSLSTPVLTRRHKSRHPFNLRYGRFRLPSFPIREIRDSDNHSRSPLPTLHLRISPHRSPALSRPTPSPPSTPPYPPNFVPTRGGIIAKYDMKVYRALIRNYPSRLSLHSSPHVPFNRMLFGTDTEPIGVITHQARPNQQFLTGFCHPSVG